MKKIITRISVLFYVILPSILCLLVTYILSLEIISSKPAYLWPLAFGVVSGIFNCKYYRFKIYFLKVLQVVLISIIISYVCFYFSIFLIPLISIFIEYILEFFRTSFYQDKYNYLYIPITVNFIAPYSLFFSHKLIFNFPKTKFTKVTILAFLVLFPIVGFFSETVDNLEPLQILLWMPLVILPIQLILYQEDIKALLKPKNV